MSAHTPGPWVYVRLDEWTHIVATAHGNSPDGNVNYWTVASINKNREPEHEANARLIASAPALLEALERLYAVAPSKAPAAGLIVGIEGRHANACAMARAAIRAAKGEA